MSGVGREQGMFRNVLYSFEIFNYSFVLILLFVQNSMLTRHFTLSWSVQGFSSGYSSAVTERTLSFERISMKRTGCVGMWLCVHIQEYLPKSMCVLLMHMAAWTSVGASI